MPEYTVKYLNKKTNRLNKIKKYAYDEETLIASLVDEGIDAKEILLNEPKLATAAQIRYLHELGDDDFPGMTLEEASDLIENAIHKREPTDKAGVEIAKIYNIPITAFTSKDKIYKKVLLTVQNRSTLELAKWFVFRVLRANFDRSAGTSISLNDSIVQAIANEILADKNLVKSLERASRESSTGFRWFGSFVSSNGREYTGDSKRTGVYKYTYERLANEGFIVSSGRKTENNEETDSALITTSHIKDKQEVSLIKRMSKGFLKILLFLFIASLVTRIIYGE